MDTPIKKAKYDRATSEQLHFYVNFCRERPQLQAGKNSPKSPRLMQELWNDLAEGLNALRGPTRTATKWKETLGVWKSQLRTRARRIKMSQRVTGGGPCAKPLTEFEELALSTFGLAAVEGATSTGSFGLSTLQEAVPHECGVDSPGGSLPSPGDSLPSPSDSLPSPGDSLPSPGDSLPSPAPTIAEGVVPENQSDTERDETMRRMRPNHLERRNMLQVLMNTLKEREEREKQREEREKLQNSIREQQQRKTVQALECLTSCVTSLVEIIKKINK